jgi:hypothetical protein
MGTTRSYACTTQAALTRLGSNVRRTSRVPLGLCARRATLLSLLPWRRVLQRLPHLERCPEKPVPIAGAQLCPWNARRELYQKVGNFVGSVISPILANIYLHELDCYVETLISAFTKGKERSLNPEYRRVMDKAARLNKKIRQEPNQEVRDSMLEEKKGMQRRMLEMPYSDQHDQEYRRLRYCRYADDFVLGAACPKGEAEEIFRKITTFLKEELKLNISQAKSGIKHNTEAIRFLGYDIIIKNDEKVIKSVVKGQHCKKRTVKSRVSINIPEAKLQSFADKKGYGNWETMEAMHRAPLTESSDADIASQYSAEMRGIAQYYALAKNFNRALGKLRFIWIQSFLKTMGSKHQTSMQKVATMLTRGAYMAVRETEREGKIREFKLFRLKDVKREAILKTEVDNPPLTFKYSAGSELLRRMDAHKCEYCKREGGYFEVHHVRKLADIKDGKQPWEKLMIARKRKTLVLCIDCHHKLTAGKLPDRRHLLK